FDYGTERSGSPLSGDLAMELKMIGRKTVLQTAAGALLALGALAATAGSASAYVVCNREGDCWHTDTRYRYPVVGFTYHPDEWYFHHSWERDHWRDYRSGRGYWRGGLWVTF